MKKIKDMKLQVIFFTLFLMLNSCKDRKTFNNESIRGVNEELKKFKAKLDPSLSSHFPEVVNDVDNFVLCNTNIEKNDFSIYLFEYNVSKKDISSLEEKIKNNKFVAIYSTKDSCLLKINKYETVKSSENNEIIQIIDSTYFKNTCFNTKLPIPNFIDYTSTNKTDFWKDPNFLIYVLDAKSGNNFKSINLPPNPQMPKEWENGFSKGIAINREKKIIIYWGITW